MILFTATWCNPCKDLKKWLDTQDFNIELVDVDENRDLAKHHGVRGIPCLSDNDKLYVGRENIQPYLENTRGIK